MTKKVPKGQDATASLGVAMLLLGVFVTAYGLASGALWRFLNLRIVYLVLMRRDVPNLLK